MMYSVLSCVFVLFREEVDIIRKKSAILSGITALEYTSTPIATLVSIITLVLTGQPLTPVNVFMFRSFISLLRMSICTNLAYGLLETYDAYASLARIEEFLSLNCFDQGADCEVDKSAVIFKRNNQIDNRKENEETSALGDVKNSKILQVAGLKKKQTKREDEFILQDIEFTAQSGSLTVITGPVGSGKSTLLSVMSGELQDSNGTVSYDGTLVYVPQLAWVFSGTIRENILFGEPYDEAKYTRIVDACALKEDIQQFPDCDETLVGERGEVLSGGQRARVSLARAVYADVDLYLLDDPLSAVDFKVGQQIFEKCIKGLLSHKTLVITSHQEQHMQEADNVIMLYKGRVLGTGSFTELKAKGILNATVDPLYKKLGENESQNSTDRENEEKDKDTSNFGRIVSQTNEAHGLQILDEDRVIGVVSSKTYWNYFRSGVSCLVIVAVICLCLITQGKSQHFCSFVEKLLSRVTSNDNYVLSLIFRHIMLYDLECNSKLSDSIRSIKRSFPSNICSGGPV